MPSLFSLPRLSLLAAACSLAACGGGAPEDAPDTAVQSAGDSPTVQTLAINTALLSPAPAGLSGNVTCVNWRIGAVTLDNVEVAPGASCQLNGTIVRGNLQAQQAASIDANKVQVAGSVQSQEGAEVVVRNGSQVRGDIEVEGGGAFAIRASTVSGNIAINGLSGTVIVRGSTISGGVQLYDNLGGGEVINNRISGSLQCTGNSPRPLVRGNTAVSIEGDCAGGGGSGSTPPVLSGNVTCLGYTIGAITLDSVNVPPGQTCTMLGTTLTGKIEVGANARLSADSVNINGGLQLDGGAVSIGGSSRMGSSVQLANSTQANLFGVLITGDLQIDNAIGPVVATGNQVSGNLQAMSNRGGLTLSNNRMGGVMQCKDNQPAPTGSGNVATQKQDQCLGL